MTFKPEQTDALAAPLQLQHVKKNPRGFSYVEAWWAITEANRIFGFDGWTRETVDLIQLGEPRLVDGKYRVAYRAKVRITVFPGVGDFGDTGLVREGCGFGSGIDKDVDQAHESALKEAESDAMKRALMTFGNPFGLALYDKTQANVTTERAPPPQIEGVVTGRQLLEAQGRKSSAQAKRDGDHERYTGEIDKADAAGCFDWLSHFDEYTATAPISWLDPLRNRIELRMEELKGQAAVAEGEAGLDAGFHGAVGERPAGVAGRGGDHQAAA